MHHYSIAGKGQTGWVVSTTMRNVMLGNLTICASVSITCKMEIIVVLTLVIIKIKQVRYM